MIVFYIYIYIYIIQYRRWTLRRFKTEETYVCQNLLLITMAVTTNVIITINTTTICYYYNYCWTPLLLLLSLILILLLLLRVSAAPSSDSRLIRGFNFRWFDFGDFILLNPPRIRDWYRDLAMISPAVSSRNYLEACVLFNERKTYF